MWTRRFKRPFQDRLSDFIADASKVVILLPEGREREVLLLKIDKAQVAATFDKWATSPELQPPKR
jgi:hypothetical protein